MYPEPPKLEDKIWCQMIALSEEMYERIMNLDPEQLIALEEMK